MKKRFSLTCSNFDRLSVALFCVIVVLTLILCNLLLLLAAILRDAFLSGASSSITSNGVLLNTDSLLALPNHAQKTWKNMEKSMYKPQKHVDFFINFTKLYSTTQQQVFSSVAVGKLEASQQQRWRRLSHLQLVGCTSVSSTEEHVASGWTKMVHRARLMDGRTVALKRIDHDAHDMRSCLANGTLVEECYERATAKFLRELVFLQHLQHPNIIKLLGFCIPTAASSTSSSPLLHTSLRKDDEELFVVAELGQPFDLIRLLQMSWDDRLRISLGLTRLLHYLANSPLGSLALKDFRRQQFVLVDGELKLSDLDDLDSSSPSCLSSLECKKYLNFDLHDDVKTGSFNSEKHQPLQARCVESHCVDYNELSNIHRAALQFSFLLQHGAPRVLQPALTSLLRAYSSNHAKTHHLHTQLGEILRIYSRGDYLRHENHSVIGNQVQLNNSNNSNVANQYRYFKFANTDLPGLHDYLCPYTMADSVCAITAHNQQEAEDFCDRDLDCHGFVWSDRRSWSGRRIVILKSGSSLRSHRMNFHLFVKPSVRLKGTLSHHQEQKKPHQQNNATNAKNIVVAAIFNDTALS